MNPIATMVDPATARKRDLFKNKATWENVYEIFADFRRKQTEEKRYVGLGMDRH